nr:transposase, MuDR, MULE transposase domain protein [Tanacetum cinerariifolium]
MFFNILESTTLEKEGPSNPEIPSSHFNDLHISNPKSTFGFRSNEYNTEDVVNENLQNKIYKWQKFMSFKPNIPETPVCKAKLNISKQYSQQSEVQKGKHYSIQHVRGSPYEAFEMLPYYCYNLEKKNEGIVTRIKTDDNRVFDMLFIAIGASIRTFLNYRSMLMINVAYLKGLYKGKNLVVVAMDGNNQIVPITFDTCKGETGPCWSWLMFVLKECIDENPNLLFISDRHAAIALAVEKEFPLAFYVEWPIVCKEETLFQASFNNVISFPLAVYRITLHWSRYELKVVLETHHLNLPEVLVTSWVITLEPTHEMVKLGIFVSVAPNPNRALEVNMESRKWYVGANNPLFGSHIEGEEVETLT